MVFAWLLWGCVRVCAHVLLKIEPQICTLGKCSNVALSGAEGATGPGRSSGPTTPPEAPATHQEAPPMPRLRPCALAQVGKRRGAGAKPCSLRLAAAHCARSRSPGRGASER